ncbi:hypothetical protein [Polaribacter sp. IC073]|uniref:hypothetical protein n=1 Tax=Polaribacter sp. IC073 TaxID=2508540 RepID=UPI0011BF0C19|nr:hypothetical protein [Polaribacter sp. IC073]TXD49699.1 hypothetical protein ES045_00495 [Polaribacter sp. IC073]
MSVLSRKYQILFEQGIISLLNFALIFVLSKLISSTLFKDFFLGYSIVIIISLVISSFANQPLQVFLKRGENNKNYIFKIFFINLLLFLIVSLIVSIVVINYYQFLVDDLIYIVILAFFTSIYDFIRRLSFVYFQDSFTSNLLSSFSILLFFFTTLIYYYSIDNISLSTVYITLIISYLLGIFIFIVLKKNKIKYIFNLKAKSIQLSFYEILKKHSNYAIWLVIGILFFWLYSQGVYFLAEKYLIVKDFNAVRISQNLVGVLSVFFVTFENIMLVKLALVFDGEDFQGINEYVQKTLKKLLLPFIGVLIVTAVIMTFLFKLYYHDNLFYSDKAVYLLYFFVYQFFFGISRVFVVALKAVNATRYILFSHAFTAIFAVLLSVILLPKFSNGHTLALIMINSIFLFSIGVYMYYRKIMIKSNHIE